MNKTAATVAVLVVGALLVFALFGRNSAEAPIVDAECPQGYERVGEGCMPAKDACEIGGDQYYYDETKQECLTR